MHDYALRCTETDYIQLLTLATALGVIDVIDGVPNEKNGGVWDYIGHKYTGDIPEEGQPDLRQPAERTN